jgi:outer membrane protease
MEDRDWLNDSFDYPTHYSRHDAYSNFAILSDVSAGYSWHLTDFFSLKAYGEFSYMHFSWFALDGYVQYPPDDPYENYQKWDDSIPKRYVSGRVMSYTLDWFVLSPGISLTAKLNRLFSLEGDFKYTPLIYCSDRDEHLKTGVTYFDYSSFGHYFRGKGSVIFSLTKNMDLSLALSYSYITGTRGDVNVEGYVFRNGAGAGYSALDLGLAAKIRLYGRD